MKTKLWIMGGIGAVVIMLAIAWGPIRQYVTPMLGLGPPGDWVDFCGLESPKDVMVAQIDVHNFYGHSEHADHHRVPADDIQRVCADHLRVLSTGGPVTEDDMVGPVTVFVLTWSDTDAPRNPLYVYWLPNKRGILIKDVGASYHVATPALLQYYSPSAEQVPRFLVPPP